MSRFDQLFEEGGYDEDEEWARNRAASDPPAFRPDYGQDFGKSAADMPTGRGWSQYGHRHRPRADMSGRKIVNQWTPRLEELAQEIADKANRNAWIFEQMVVSSKRWGDAFTISSGIISGIVGVEGLITIFGTGEVELWLQIMMTILSFFSMVLLTINNTWKPTETGAAALSAQVKFQSIQRNITLQLALEVIARNKGEDYVRSMLDEYESADLAAPTKFPGVVRRADIRFGSVSGPSRRPAAEQNETHTSQGLRAELNVVRETRQTLQRVRASGFGRALAGPRAPQHYRQRRRRADNAPPPSLDLNHPPAATDLITGRLKSFRQPSVESSRSVPAHTTIDIPERSHPIRRSYSVENTAEYTDDTHPTLPAEDKCQPATQPVPPTGEARQNAVNDWSAVVTLTKSDDSTDSSLEELLGIDRPRTDEELTEWEIGNILGNIPQKIVKGSDLL